MRILMVSDTYFPRISGVASSIRSFRAGLTRLGHEVDLLIPAYGAGDSEDPGIFQTPAWRIAPYEGLFHQGLHQVTVFGH